MTEQAEHQDSDDLKAPPERKETLWLLVVGPAIWALHFVLSYGTAAIWCAKFAGQSGSLYGARIAVAIYSLCALVGIGFATWRAVRRATFGSATVPHDFDTAGDRHRFLGFASVLLCGLSLVATAYVTLSVAFIQSCQ